MNEDVIKIYEYCKLRQKIADDNLSKVQIGSELCTQFSAEGTAYWSIQQFIFENFNNEN